MDHEPASNDADPPPFDYGEPAELYFPVLIGRRGGLDYRRFPTAAHALQYAIESLATERLSSATLEVAGERFDRVAMRELYEAHFGQPAGATETPGTSKLTRTIAD